MNKNTINKNKINYLNFFLIFNSRLLQIFFKFLFFFLENFKNKNFNFFLK